MRIGTLDGILPAVNFASRATAESGSSWGLRMIPDCQLFYVISGHAELAIGRCAYMIRAGECVFYGPDTPHRLSVIETTEYFSIHYDWHRSSPLPVHPGHLIRSAESGALRNSDTNLVLLNVPPNGEIAIPTLLTVSGLEPIFTRMVKEYELEQPGYALALRSLMMQAITAIIRQLLGSGAHQKLPGKIDSAIQALQNEPNRNWPVSELAAMCGYHPIHFAKLFKDELGMTPKAYVITERIKQAKRALLQGEKMEVISEKLGFASIHYFSHQFKQLTGLTPSEFRLQGRLREE